MSTPYSSAGKSFKDLKQTQKARITDYMYLETQNFFSVNKRMPVSVEDCETIVRKVCGHINIQISFRFCFSFVRSFQNLDFCAPIRPRPRALWIHLMPDSDSGPWEFHPCASAQLFREVSLSCPHRRRLTGC